MAAGRGALTFVAVVTVQIGACLVTAAFGGPSALAMLFAAAVVGWFGVRSSDGHAPIAVASGTASLGIGGPIVVLALLSYRGTRDWWITAVALAIPLLLTSRVLTEAARAFMVVVEQQSAANRRQLALETYLTAHHLKRETTQAVDRGIAALVGSSASSLARIRQAAIKVTEGEERLYARYEKQAKQTVGGSHTANTQDRHSTMRLWGDPNNLPAGAARLWAPIGGVLDIVRLLHTVRIEWLSLLATLWLRAIIVVNVPTLALWPGVGVVPHYPPTRLADVVWLFAVAWSVATALAAPFVVARAEQANAVRVRRALTAIELPISVALLVACPSWASATFSTGVLNWLQRPTWRARVLIGFSAAVLGLFLTGTALHGISSPLAVTAETLLGVVALILISCSYGLILPLTVAAFWDVLRRRGGRALASKRERKQFTADALNALSMASKAISGLGDKAGSSTPNLALVEASAILDRAVLVVRAETTAQSPWRTRRTLGDILDEAIRILPEAGTRLADEATSIHPTFWPPKLKHALVGRRFRRDLAKVARLAAFEALGHGSGPLHTNFEILSQHTLEMSFINEPREDGHVGRGTGGDAIEGAARRLPGGTMVERRLSLSDPASPFRGRSIFIVRLHFDARVLEDRGDGEGEAENERSEGRTRIE